MKKEDNSVTCGTHRVIVQLEMGGGGGARMEMKKDNSVTCGTHRVIVQLEMGWGVGGGGDEERQFSYLQEVQGDSPVGWGWGGGE